MTGEEVKEKISVEEEVDFDVSQLKKKKKKPKAVSFDAVNSEDNDSEGEVNKEDKDEGSVDDVNEMFTGLKKKKKKSTKNSEESENKSSDDSNEKNDAEDNVPNDDSELTFTKKKKKKKSTSSSSTSGSKSGVDEDDFEAQLKKAGLESSLPKSGSSTALSSGYSSKDIERAVESVPEVIRLEDDLDLEEPNKAVVYTELLRRFFYVLREKNPELAGDRSGTKYKIPPPIVMRDGNKKTVFANIKDICARMHRPTEHVTHFLFTELGTTGSVDGSARLVIKGRFQQKQLENVLRRYIVEYVTCKTCKSANTLLEKENRLYFVICQSCGSRRSVQSIKTGYHANLSRRKKA